MKAGATVTLGVNLGKTGAKGAIVRVQHATSTTAADSIMAGKRLVAETSDRLVYGLKTETPGAVKLTQGEILGTGAKYADEIIEFDVPLKQLRLNDIGDVILPSPVDLSTRNAIRLPVPKSR